MDLFAPDPRYLDTLNVNTWTGLPGLGHINNVTIANLRMEVATGGGITAPQHASMAAIRFEGVTESQIYENEINNFLFPIIVSANECDSSFFVGDGDWGTKAWHNKIYSNSISNTGYTSGTNWTTGGGQDTLKKYGGAAISLIVANNVEVYNNDISFVGGPKIFAPLISKASIFDNNFESSNTFDTLNPWVIIGFWDTAGASVDTPPTKWADYDSTHRVVNSESLDCALYDYVPGDADYAISQRGARGVAFYNNRFESGPSIKHLANLAIGWNAKATSVYGNSFSRVSGTNTKFVVGDKGASTDWGVNNWPINGREDYWGFGEKALWHAIKSQPNGGTILLGPYTYEVDLGSDDAAPTGAPDCIDIPSNVTIKGVPGKTVIQLDDSIDWAVSNQWDVQRGIFNIAGDSNVVIQDIIFDSNSEFADSNGAANSATVINNRHKAIVLGFTTGDLVTKNITIKNCVFKNWVHGIQIQSDGRFEEVNIEDNTFIPQTLWNMNTDAFMITSTTAGDSLIGVIIDNNHIIDNGIRLIPTTGVTAGRVAEQILPTSNMRHSIISNNYTDVKISTAALRVDTLFSYTGFAAANTGNTWSVVWQPYSVILFSDHVGNVGGWVKMNDNLSYTMPYNSELVTAIVAVDDTSSLFNLELYRHTLAEPNDIKHTAAPTVTDTIFRIAITRADTVRYGTPIGVGGSVLGYDLYEKREFPQNVPLTTFLAGDVLKPFARITSGEYANGLTLTMIFRRR
jgi:hypothetical protein